MADAGPHGNFHRFNQLPPEIRDMIWSLCRPHRVIELDAPADWAIFRFQRPSPCKLWQTTRCNTHAPRISHVCHEARTVALRKLAIKTFPCKDPSHTSYWITDTRYPLAGRPWPDSMRDSPHLNWGHFYSLEFISHGSPLDHLAWERSCMSGRASLMLEYFGVKRSRPPLLRDVKLPMRQFEIRDRDVLKRFPSWQVVMRMMIIHSDLKTAVATNLWGALGEEVVQIVDATDEQRCDEYYQVAEACEQRASPLVTAPQKFDREPLHAMKQRLKDAIMEAYECEDLLNTMHPAIMFRLCTSRCDERELSWSDDEDCPY